MPHQGLRREQNRPGLEIDNIEVLTSTAKVEMMGESIEITLDDAFITGPGGWPPSITAICWLAAASCPLPCLWSALGQFV